MAGIFVYGGCVTRDTFEFFKEEHTLTGYVARQSLISAASAPTKLAGPISGQGFELRSVKGDLNSSLHKALTAAADKTDLFAMDLLVERSGVLGLPDGSYATHSPNMQRSGALDAVWPKIKRVKMGTDQHFTLWKRSAGKLVDVLKDTDLLERTLLVNTPWAAETVSGEPVPPYLDWTPEHAAKVYDPYYSYLESLGVATIRLPDKLVVSSMEHRWGPSPYHYAPPAYEWMRDQMEKFLRGEALDRTHQQPSTSEGGLQRWIRGWTESNGRKA
ncbi:MAG: DUF6270 domain-containing protein [Arthrobacter sp.]